MTRTMRCAVVREHGGLDRVAIAERPVPAPPGAPALGRV